MHMKTYPAGQILPEINNMLSFRRNIGSQRFDFRCRADRFADLGMQVVKRVVFLFYTSPGAVVQLFAVPTVNFPACIILFTGKEITEADWSFCTLFCPVRDKKDFPSICKLRTELIQYCIGLLCSLIAHGGIGAEVPSVCHVKSKYIFTFLQNFRYVINLVEKTGIIGRILRCESAPVNSFPVNGSFINSMAGHIESGLLNSLIQNEITAKEDRGRLITESLFPLF